MRTWWLLTLMLSVNISLDGQTKRIIRPQSHKQVTTRTSTNPVKTPIDSTDRPTPVLTITPPVTDTVVKDTVAQSTISDIKDTVAAQVKSPIVQVPVTLKSLIVPGVLFTYGALTLNTGKLRQINEVVHKATARTDQPFKKPFVEDYLLFAPAVTVYGLNFAGIKGQNNFIDRTLLYGMSELLSSSIIYGVKRLGIETRPDSSDRYSFPSGHTAEAFICAEFLHQEYKGRVHWTVIAAGYTVAASVAYLRMYHNKHYLSDVVAGAGVGIAATRFSYYLYPLLKHVIFGSRKVKGDAMIIPTYSTGGAVGFALVKRF